AVVDPDLPRWALRRADRTIACAAAAGSPDLRLAGGAGFVGPGEVRSRASGAAACSPVQGLAIAKAGGVARKLAFPRLASTPSAVAADDRSSRGRERRRGQLPASARAPVSAGIALAVRFHDRWNWHDSRQ